MNSPGFLLRGQRLIFGLSRHFKMIVEKCLLFRTSTGCILTVGEKKKVKMFYKINTDLSGCRSLVLRGRDELGGDEETLTGQPETADPFYLTSLSPKTSKTPPRPFSRLSTAKFRGFCSEKTGRSPALFSATGAELAKSYFRQQQAASAQCILNKAQQ